jgi:succinyldiaminopimelate transaminase
MNPALRALRPYPMVELERRKQELKSAGTTVFDFGTGDPIEATPPFIAEALKAAVPTISQYPSVAGTAKLRQAAAAYLRRRFGVEIDPGTEVLPSAGSKESIFHLPLAFLDPSSGRDTVIFGTPGYPVYEHGTLFAGGQTHGVVLHAGDGWRLDLTELPEDLLQRSAIVWLNYPHNPSGAVVDRAYLAEQYAVCRAHGILLASDECYADMWFDDCPPPPSALEVGREGVLVFHSCSKRSGMTGYRSGFVAGDATLIAAFRRWRAAMGVASPAFVEAAGAAAWADDVHAAERRAIFAAKKRLLAEGLAQLGVTVEASDAGLYLWARVPGDGDADRYATRCLERGLVISPGPFFGAGGEGRFRLALVPSLDDCRLALERWPRD